MATAEKKLAEKFGKLGAPIEATQVLAMPLEHFQNEGMDAHALICVNEEAGTYTAANAYPFADGGHKTGKGFDPVHYTYPITDKARKKWKKKGYEEVDMADFDIVREPGAEWEAPEAD